jgi:hypothetical protein
LLLLRRKPGRWVKAIHSKSGDVIWIGVDCDSAEIKIAIDDPNRNFEIVKHERDNGERTVVAPSKEKSRASH